MVEVEREPQRVDVPGDEDERDDAADPLQRVEEAVAIGEVRRGAEVGARHHDEAVERVIEDRRPQHGDLDREENRNRNRRDAGDELIELRAAAEDEGVLEVDVHQHVGADRHDAGERMQSTEDEVQAVLIDRRHAARHRRVDRHAVTLRAGS